MKTEKSPSNKSHDSNRVASAYEQYGNELHGFISKRIRLKEDVEDILQDVFYKLSQADQYDDTIEQLSSWLYTVAQNRITDHYRKKKELRMNDNTDNEGEDEQVVDQLLQFIADPSPDPETAYLQSLVWIELEAALEEMPPAQRSVFELNELEGFSFKEISESTQIPINTLLSRKHYATLYLREKLALLYKEILGE